MREIEGVGKAMEEKIEEIIETDSLGYLEELKEELLPGLIDVMRVPDIGPKSAKKLYEKLDVVDLDTLKEEAEAENIWELKGFGEKTQEKILKGIEMLEDISGRHLLNEVIPVSEDLIDHLEPKAERPLQRRETYLNFIIRQT